MKLLTARVISAILAATAGSLFASSDDAWAEFRKDVSAKMERAIKGTFASHSVFVEPFGSESYGIAIASGISAGDKRRLTVFGIYDKKTKKLETIEAPELTFDGKGADNGGKASAGAKNAGTTKSSVDLLLGKWRQVEDKTNFLDFEKNVRKESSDGGKTWDRTTFILGSQCQNPADSGRPKETSANDLFISTADDLCWHIDSVDEKELVLTYIGRGNMLRYVRVTK